MLIPYVMNILSFSQGTAGKMNRWGFALLAAGLLAAGRPANGQLPVELQSRFPGLPTKLPQTRPSVPPAYRPPSGMCRIWLEGVPASKQPAPTDCVTAVRNRPVNGHVIFGDSPERGKGKTKKGKSKKE